MKKLVILMSFLLFSSYSAQNNIKELSKITEEIMRLYVEDTLKRPFKYGDNIALSIFSDSFSDKSDLYIETLGKDFKLYENTTNYKWFIFQKKNIIIFCGFNDANKCEKYFKSLNFNEDKSNFTQVLNMATPSDILDENSKFWHLSLNKNNKITDISGKIIEAEIVNPVEFRKVLKKYSTLKLYQLNEGGPIVFPYKNTTM